MQPVQPVGVFDSGVGGLTVAREITRQLPAETIIYYGDTAHVPYGSRTVDELIGFADAIAGFLIAKGAKAIVDACNTTSAVALPYLQKKYQVPIIGVIEPGIIEALRATQNGRIGVMATEATVASNAHREALLARSGEVQVFARACPKLVPLVEAGLVSGPQVEAAVAEYVEPLVEAGIDTLILGCTHYPFLAPVIQEVAGPGVTLIDPAAATVRELKEVLAAGGGLRLPHFSQAHNFFVSGDARAFSEVGFKLVGWPELKGARKLELE
ncbi:glutamate racemase [Neomoorella mulderi]|uniref:Glutamate racemase n=1 Tax=Moorella mulderi DSM 14980 TaxID=1122241 RepID=A0A151AW69_9FIRM|nr:glutamate racemase [Moorella mulderi]KYH31878.1 glutamate racemase [Moorella mulderi DSM 14980]